MHCTVLLFAQLRESIGRDRLAIDLPPHATVGDALKQLKHAHPSIAAMAPHLAVAVDAKYCGPDADLRDGCEIALIPPVSGG